MSLSADGFTVAIGGDGTGVNGSQSGHVRVHRYSSVSRLWERVGGDLNGEATGDQFDISVALSLDGTLLAAGDSDNDTNVSNAASGMVGMSDMACQTLVS